MVNPALPVRLISLAAAFPACLGLALAADASGEVVGAGNLAVSFDGAISPAKLPRNAYLPIAMHFDGSFKTTNGSQLPDLSMVAVQFDRHG